MFSKFTSIIHNAAQALAPSPPLQQDFVAHWKAVTHYFIDNKEHKVAVEQTLIPGHLESMLELLVAEEEVADGGATGPCMEYTLQHKILETLYTLARTDCPPGMKQLVLQFFTKLLSRIRQPLLPHVNVHRPVHRLMRVCGEAQASPTENEEIQFLCTVCAKLRTDPYLVSFFIESTSRSGTSPPGSPPSGALPASTEETHERLPSFSLVDSLLNLMHSEDARVGVKACEGLILCSSLPENSAAQCLAKTSRFCTELVNQLCKLYDKLPKEMDPADIICVQAKWGLDVMSSSEDYHNFPGKRALISFLSWLDYCDQLIQVAHQSVGKSLSTAIREQFLENILQPSILQPSESGAVTATAHLVRCIQLVSSTELLAEFVHFVIGDERKVEALGGPSPKLRQRLIERCDHLSDEMCLSSLRVFEALLQKPSEHAVHNLVLRNLLGRSYVDMAALELLQNQEDKDDKEQGDTAENEDSSKSKDLSNADSGGDGKDNHSDAKVDEESSKNCNESSAIASDEKLEEKTENDTGDKQDEKSDVLEDSGICDSPSGNSEDRTTENVDKRVEDDRRERELEDDLSPPLSPTHRGPAIHTIVNSFLIMVPEEAKSSYQMADSGYDTYLRDAHRQFSDTCSQCSAYNWPQDPQSCPENQSTPFFEGSFLKVLMDKMAHLFDQSYDVNLQVTSLLSQLSLMPHPNLHEYLLNPLLPTTTDGSRNLPSIIKKVVQDLQSRMKNKPEFQKQLFGVRKQLMGMTNNIRRTQGGTPPQSCAEEGQMLEAVIVLEEFCKELAAIAFVKHHAITS